MCDVPDLPPFVPLPVVTLDCSEFIVTYTLFSPLQLLRLAMQS